MEQSKRLYGLIGSGEVLAPILGGLGAAAVVRQIGTLTLLLITAGGLAGALGSLLALKPHFLQPGTPVGAPASLENDYPDIEVGASAPSLYGMIPNHPRGQLLGLQRQ